MTINSYSTLKTAVSDWSDRTDLTDAMLSDIVMLAESGLNRELRMVETDATLTGVVGSRAIDISSLDIIAPIALFIVDSGQEYEVLPRPDGSFTYSTENAYPTYYGIDGDYINFDSPLDQAYSFRFRYNSKFALSSVVTTNQLLQDHPDVYLAACMMWGGLRVQDDARAQMYSSLLDGYIRSVRAVVGRNKRGTLVSDPMLSFPQRDGTYRW